MDQNLTRIFLQLRYRLRPPTSARENYKGASSDANGSFFPKKIASFSPDDQESCECLM